MAARSHHEHLRLAGLSEQDLRGVALTGHDVHGACAISTQHLDELSFGNVDGSLAELVGAEAAIGGIWPSVGTCHADTTLSVI